VLPNSQVLLENAEVTVTDAYLSRKSGKISRHRIRAGLGNGCIAIHMIVPENCIQVTPVEPRRSSDKHQD